MTLAIFVGDGAVGRHVVGRVPEVEPGAAVFALRKVAPVVQKIIPNSKAIADLTAESFLEVLAAVNATEIVVAGNFFTSRRKPRLKGMILEYSRTHRSSLWSPHLFLAFAHNALSERNIEIRGLPDLFTELRMESDLSIGSLGGLDPAQVLNIAKRHVSDHNSWQTAKQAWIIDGGQVVPVDAPTTDDLILAFGASQHRARARFPILCRLSTPPFGLLDPPVIGPTTLELCAANGLRAIVVEAGKTVLLRREEVLSAATNQSVGLFGR